MKRPAIGVLLLILLCYAVAPALALNEEKFSYITVQNVDITLDNASARIKMNYAIDDGTRFIVMLLGKQDLKNKLIKILNYEDVVVKNIELDSAEILINDASYTYGRGIYWFPSHEFNVNIPTLTVHTPQTSRQYTNVNEFPQGIGYFDTTGG
jgi:hypothetical protein